MTEGVAAVLISSVLGPVVVLWAQHRWKSDIKEKIGEPNGHGSLVSMVQSVLDGQRDQDDRLARLDIRVATVEQRLGVVDHRLDELAEVDHLGRQGRIDRRRADGT